MDVPQVQYIVEIVGEPVVMQGQVPTTQTVQETVEVSRVPFPDRVVDVPVLFVKKEIIEVTDTVTHRRVSIMDDCDELIPEWLNFVKGVIDSEDIPLNISRETLQQNKILRVIKKNHVKKRLDMLAETAELNDDQKKFYEQCVICMKLGIRENSVNDFEIYELLRLNTSKSGDEQISLKEYVDHMKEGQNDISHITGESIEVVSSSSFRENLRKKGYEVLYVADPVDEYAVQQLREFDRENTLQADKEPASELDGGCAAQAPECVELQRLRAEGLVAVPDTIKLLNDYDRHRKTYCSTSVDRTEGEVKSLAVDIKSHESVSAAKHRSNRSTQQRRQWQQPRKKEEEGKEEKGRAEIEKGRKGQRGRGQEGRETEEEGEAEQAGSEQVKKDVTGWTEVLRNKRRR